MPVAPTAKVAEDSALLLLKELKRENARLKKLLAEQALEIEILQEAAKGD